MSGSKPPRVVFYEPYAPWLLHGYHAGTMAHAVEAQGAEVTFVQCDALFTDCALYRQAFFDPRPPTACLDCQAMALGNARLLGISPIWLGRYLHAEEHRLAREWAESLPVEELVAASYGDWEIGRWVGFSLAFHIRDGYPDPRDPEVERVMRRFACDGLIACFAFDRLFREVRPDVLVVFYGLLYSTRIALEVARLHGIRVISHWRAAQGESLRLTENRPCGAPEAQDQYWDAWGRVPLSAEEINELESYLSASEHGDSETVISFAASSQSAESVSKSLGLSKERTTWVLFNSSGEDDRVLTDDPAFSSQNEWIKDTVEYARAHPEIDLVIRAHPNIGTLNAPGHNRRQLDELSRLKPDLPPNVVVVDPESSVNSYALMDVANAGLVWASTTGLEMAVRGKRVVTAAHGYVWERPYSYSVRSRGEYYGVLDKLRATANAPADPEIARLAMREAYGVFCRQDVGFPLVRSTGFNEGELLYSDMSALSVEQIESLLRVSRIVLGDEPICPPPSLEQMARSYAAEDAALRRHFGQKTPVLAIADELLDEPALLAKWIATKEAAHGMRLMIETRGEQLDALVSLVGGLESADDPRTELVAGQFDAELSGTELSANQAVRPVAILTRDPLRWRGLLGQRGFAELPAVDDPETLLAALNQG